jgi:hypothetical protein
MQLIGLHRTIRDMLSIIRGLLITLLHEVGVEANTTWPSILAGVCQSPTVFKVNQRSSFSTDDGAVEARQQLPDDLLPTADCTLCRRSTAKITP